MCWFYGNATKERLFKILVKAQAKQEYMHYHSDHQKVILCIYYSTFIEMRKLVSILVIDTKTFNNSTQ